MWGRACSVFLPRLPGADPTAATAASAVSSESAAHSHPPALIPHPSAALASAPPWTALHLLANSTRAPTFALPMSHYRPSTGSAAAAAAARPGTASSSNSHGDGGVSFKLKRFLLRYYPPG